MKPRDEVTADGPNNLKERKVYKWLFRAAAALSGLGLIAHELLGAPSVLKPLATTTLPEEVIWLHHFSWHVGTVATAAMVSMFIFASMRSNQLPMAIVATAMSLGFAALGIALALGQGQALWQTPAPYLWSLVAAVGCLGIWQALAKNSNP